MPTPDNKMDLNTDQKQEQPVRETSQTDHLNKKLLTSLFKRMDEDDDTILAKMLKDNKTEEVEDEWKD